MEERKIDRKTLGSRFFLSISAFFYNFVFLVFGIFYLPFFIKRLKQAENVSELIRQRSGAFPSEIQEKLKGRKVIWLHAVSVGEVMGVSHFVNKLLETFSEIHIVLTTVTPTGQKIAKKLERHCLSVCYFPFDVSWAMKSFFKAMHPSAVLLVETEIWPNFLREAQKGSVPVGIINGRLSERSSQGYARFRSIFYPFFSTFRFVLAQTEQDGKRFKQLGVSPDRVVVTGNLKFDNVDLSVSSENLNHKFRTRFGIRSDESVIVGGSTHPREEGILLNIFGELKRSHSHLKLILAPRHVDRADAIAQLASKKGFSCQRTSDFDRQVSYQVLILDEMGILKNLYAAADIVFVGGSFVHHGGQNPIEPAVLKKPIVVGPHVFNFEKVYQGLMKNEGALSIQKASELTAVFQMLLENRETRDRLGRHAYQAVSEMQGATDKSIQFLANNSKFFINERIDQDERSSRLFSPSC